MASDFRVVLHEVTRTGVRTLNGWASVLLPRVKTARIGTRAYYVYEDGSVSEDLAGEVTNASYCVIPRKDGKPDRRHKRSWFYDCGYEVDGPKTGPVMTGGAP